MLHHNHYCFYIDNKLLYLNNKKAYKIFKLLYSNIDN